MTANVSPNPVCSLEVHAFQERVKWIAALNRQYLLRHMRSDRSLTLIYQAAALGQVEDMVMRERECCSFLQFDLRRGAAVELIITVPANNVGSDDPDELLAPFYRPQTSADFTACCGSCETHAPPVGVNRAAGVAIATSVTAVIACGAGCIIPVMIPAIATTAAGGVLAWLGKGHAWMTALAVLMVVMTWLWIWRQGTKRRMRASRLTMGLMGAASVIAMLAVIWPHLEPSLMAALAP